MAIAERNLEPEEPPFQIGDRIRYIGQTSFSYGGNPMVEPGDVGEVVENCRGSGGYPLLGHEFAEPLDGWSVVKIKGNRIAVGKESLDRYEKVP